MCHNTHTHTHTHTHVNPLVHKCVCTLKTNTQPHLQPCCSVVLKTELITKFPLCVSFKVASNKDVSLFKEFISRNFSDFSGLLEIIWGGCTFFFPQCTTNTMDTHTRTHTHTPCILCDSLKNGYTFFISAISVLPKKLNHISIKCMSPVGFWQETTKTKPISDLSWYIMWLTRGTNPPVLLCNDYLSYILTLWVSYVFPEHRNSDFWWLTEEGSKT